MASVVIAAHNEATVIGATLDALLASAAPGELDVVVVPNGCTDDTAAVARAHGARVVELAESGKPGALNAGDTIATGFPRIYLDADIRTDADTIRALVAALGGPGAPLAVFPARRLDLSGRPLLVKAYFAVNNRLPVFREGLFGRGLVALSEEGRRRFAVFPSMQADDLFLDSLFAENEKHEVSSVAAVVAAPLTTTALLSRLVRVRRANAAMRAVADGALPGDVRRSDKWSWLRDVVARRPWLAPAGVVYAALTLLAERRARRAPASTAWERDDTTRGVLA